MVRISVPLQGNRSAISSPERLVALAMALGADTVPGWSAEETNLTRSLTTPPPQHIIAEVGQAILDGEDPLGDIFCQLRPPEQRRVLGATYTPHAVVKAMLDWAAQDFSPGRVIDPGTGSARFLIAAGRCFPTASLIGVEIDPLATIIARGQLAAAGLANRATIVLGDYRTFLPPPIDASTLYIGNPPYVRHHLLGATWKSWLVRTARQHGLVASQLAGLHVYFFLATANLAQPGDKGVYITAAEWLDVNYGKVVRDLLLHTLGAETIQIIEPTAALFPDAAATGVITGFQVGTRPTTVGFSRVDSLAELNALTPAIRVHREQLQSTSRWTSLTRSVTERRAGFIELGEFCRVHRGQVTGANRIWIANDAMPELPATVLFPTVTRARELFTVKHTLDDASVLRQVIDLPVDLDVFSRQERAQIDRFLDWARALGAPDGFIARYRKAWWSVGLREPAPILATYMARRPPRFVRNTAAVRHINIAHGLYPREQLTEEQLRALSIYLSRTISLEAGRSYAGGLTKFEPREMERLLVPHPDLIVATLDSETIV